MLENLFRDNKQLIPTRKVQRLGSLRKSSLKQGMIYNKSKIQSDLYSDVKLTIMENYSDRYKLMEDTLIKIAEGTDPKCMTEKIYAMDPMSKVLTDNFMLAREQMLLLSKTNMDVNKLLVYVKFS